MRTIKFRGKRIDSGEWVYGGLLYSGQNNVFIVKRIMFRDDSKSCDVAENYKVIPKTVGQYIELEDINNKEISTGDIVEDRFGDKGVVSWDHGELYIKGLEFKHWYNLMVIGNIHDNPELLEQEDG